MPPGKGQMTPLLPPPKVPMLAPKGAQAPAAEGGTCPSARSCPQMAAEGPSSPQGCNKKKSRKHQRFLERRALLEQKGLLRPRKRPGSQAPAARLTEDTCSPPVVPTAEPQSGKVGKPKQVLSLSASPDSIARHHSVLLSQDDRGSSAEVGTSSPLLRPGKYVAIDCEMVGTGPRGKLSELARCTIVNYEGDVVYDKYIQPAFPIVDYRTRWSGITKRHMKNAIPFRAAQAEILKILKDKIVVGHAIHNDFQALKYFHPKDKTRDTSRIPLLNQKAGFPVKVNASLKSLAKHLLHKKIQIGRKGHSSVEDAQTTMELYRLVEVQWEKELASSLPPRAPSPVADSSTDSDQYMDDQYWPTHLNIDSL
ncbi:apoptosis-enhancing nuclease [Rhea pennata]|uniref:apoptosis-enhancing nuclease n=1 Tax=Rhea pennata TaxID=8795 RepID=UPI002E26A89B